MKPTNVSGRPRRKLTALALALEPRILLDAAAVATAADTAAQMDVQSTADSADANVALNGTTNSYSAGEPAIQLVGDASIKDKSGSFSGAVLTIVREGGANAEDVFSYRVENAAENDWGWSYDSATKQFTQNGNVVATVDDSTAGQWIIRFNSDASWPQVGSVLHRVGYSNTGSDSETVTLEIAYSDDSNYAGSAFTEITVTGDGTVIPETELPIQATPNNPSYPVNPDFSSDLFSDVTVSSSSQYNELVISVDASGPRHALIVDGTSIELTAGNLGTTQSEYAYEVSSNGDSTVIKISLLASGDSVSAAQLQSLIDGLAYQAKDSSVPSGTLTVALTSVSDSEDTVTELDIKSIVTLDNQINLPPVVEIKTGLEAADSYILSELGVAISVTYSPDGEYLYAANGGGTLMVFKTDEAGRLTRIQTLEKIGANRTSLNQIIASGDGKQLYVSSEDKVVILAVGADGKLGNPSDVSVRGDVRSMALADDGNNLYVLNYEGVDVFVRNGDGSLSLVQTPHTADLAANTHGFVKLVSAGKYVFAVSDVAVSTTEGLADMLVVMERTNEGKLQRLGGTITSTGQGNATFSLVSSEDGNRVYLSSSDGWIKVYSTGNNMPQIASVNLADVNAIHLSSDGRTLYATTSEGQLATYDIGAEGALTLRNTFSGIDKSGVITSSADGNHLILGGDSLSRYSHVQTVIYGEPATIAQGVSLSDSNLDALNGGQGDYKGLQLTISRAGGGQAGDLFGFAEANGLTYANGLISKDGAVIASFEQSAATLTITFSGTTTTADANRVLQQVTYTRDSVADGSTQVNLSVTANDGQLDSNVANIALLLTLNSAPSVDSQVRDDLTYKTTGTPLPLFTGTTINTGDTGQTIVSLSLGLSGLTAPGGEKLLIGGTLIDLSASGSGTTASGHSYSYTLDSDTGVATLTLSHAEGVSVAAMRALVDGISYQVDDGSNGTGTRTITLTAVQDSGGTLNGGVDSVELNISATLTLALNQAPVIEASSPADPTLLYSDGVLSGNSDQVSSITLSGDGKTLIVSSYSSTLAGMGTSYMRVYARDTVTGALTLLQTFTQGTNDGDDSNGIEVDGVKLISSSVMSADGKQLYVAGQSSQGGAAAYSIVHFSRDEASGELVYQGIVATHGVDGVSGLNASINEMVISSDGKTLYTINGLSRVYSTSTFYMDTFAVVQQQHAVAAFAIDSSSGSLSQVAAYEGAEFGLSAPSGITLSADGKSVYVSNNSSNSLSIFNRSADGSLSYAGQVNRDSISADPNSGEQPETAYLGRLQDVVVSADGAYVYAVSNEHGKVSIFSRDAATGALTYVSTLDLTSKSNSFHSLTLSEDGSRLYVAGSSNTLLILSRDAASGALTLAGSVDMATTTAHIAVSADGLSVYGGHSNRNEGGLSVAGTLNHTSYTGTRDSLITAGLNISDPDNDASGDYSGTEITIKRNGEASADDAFSLRSGNGLSLANGQVMLDGAAIADFTSADGVLKITFTAAVSREVANQVLHQVTYRNAVSPDRVVLNIQVSDGQKSSSLALALIHAAPADNAAPTLGDAAQNYKLDNAIAGKPYNLVLPEALFTDADGDDLTWSTSQLPDGLSFDPETRTISGTPGTPGELSITIKVTDGIAEASLELTLSVGNPNLQPTVGADRTDLSYGETIDGWSPDVQADVLTGASDVQTSADGKYLYVISNPSVGTASVSVYSRDADGKLQHLQTLFDAARDGGISGLSGATRLVMSSDGQSLYAINNADNSILLFSRDASSGQLALSARIDSSVIGDNAFISDITGRADQLYVSTSDGVMLLVREDDGSFSLAKTYQNGGDGMSGLEGAQRLQLSADGQTLFVATSGASTLVTALRIGNDGSLSFIGTINSGNDSSYYISDLALSPDGRTLYAIHSDSGNSRLEVLSVGNDGSLTLLGSTELGASANELVVGLDGAAVFVATEKSVVVFTRDADGSLQRYAELAHGDDDWFDAFGQLSGLSLSADGKQLYVTGVVGRYAESSSLFTLDINLPVLTYTEGDAPGSLIPGANLNSPILDATDDYAGAGLVLVRASGASADDTFSFTNASGLSLEGDQILKDGSAIASFSQIDGTLTITFLAGTRQADAQQVLRQISYANSSQDPVRDGARQSISITFTDGKGNNASTSVDVDLVGVNTPPVIETTGRTPTFNAEGEAVKLFDGTQVDAVESGQNIWQVIVTLDAANAGDVLGVNGGKILLGGDTSGKTATGIEYRVSVENGSTQVILYLNVSAAEAAKVIDSLTFSNSGDALSGTRNVTVSVKDVGGGNDTSTAASSAVVSLAPALAQNTPPDLSVGGDAGYTEQAEPIAIAPAAQVSDSQMDSFNNGAGNYDGATLTITLGDGKSAADKLGFKADNGLSLVGSALQKDGKVIGSVTIADGVMTITFSDAQGTIPTTADVQNTLRQITYANSSDVPVASVAVSITLADQRGLESATQTLSIDITPINDAPVINDDPILSLGDLEHLQDLTDIPGLSTPTGSVVSSDGNRVYIADDKGNIALFARNPDTGELSHSDTFTAANGLTNIKQMVMSADGKSLYVLRADGNAIDQFSLAEDGKPEHRATVVSDFLVDSNAFTNVKSIALSADGKTLYLVNEYNLVQVDRDPATGTLTYSGMVEGDMSNQPYLWQPSELVVKGNLVFIVTSPTNGTPALIVYQHGSDGLTLLAHAANGETDANGQNITLGRLGHIAVSADGRTIFVANSTTTDWSGNTTEHPQKVDAFSLDPSTGALTHKGTITDAPTVKDIALSGDGKALFVTRGDGSLVYYSAVTLEALSTSQAAPVSVWADGGVIVTGGNLIVLSAPGVPGPTLEVNGAPVVLFPALTLNDAELDAANDYQGASVTISGQAGDQFGFLDNDTYRLDGERVLRGDVEVATLVQSGTSAVLSFAAGVSQSEATALLRQVTYTSTSAVPGSHAVSIVFNDGEANSPARSIEVTLLAGNQAPVVNDPNYALIVAKTGQAYSITLPADLFSDPDGDSLTWEVSGLPQGLSYDPVTRTLSGTTTAMGSHAVTITATDSRNASVTLELTLVVENSAPVIGRDYTPPRAMSGESYSATLPADLFSDPDGDSLTWEVSGLPQGLSYDPVTRTLSGTTTAMGNHAVTITATDSHNASVTLELTLVVENSAPVIGRDYTPPRAMAGESYSVTLPADLFSAPNGDSLTWEVSGLPQGLSYDPVTRTLSGTTTAMGSHAVTITATNSRNASVTLELTLVVENSAPVIGRDYTPPQATAGESYSVTLPADLFRDVNDAQLSWSLDNLPDWLSFDAGTRTLSGTAPAESGSYVITLTAEDAQGASVSRTLTLLVAQPVTVPDIDTVLPEVHTPTAQPASTPAPTSFGGPALNTPVFGPSDDGFAANEQMPAPPTSQSLLRSSTGSGLADGRDSLSEQLANADRVLTDSGQQDARGSFRFDGATLRSSVDLRQGTGSSVSLQLPVEPGTRIILANGLPLPSNVSFDSRTGELRIDRERLQRDGVLRLTLISRDGEGKEQRTPVEIRTEQAPANAERTTEPAPAQVESLPQRLQQETSSALLSDALDLLDQLSDLAGEPVAATTRHSA